MTERRLAAILHADVVGYSRLMEEAETRTFRELKSLFNSVWRPVLKSHAGRLVHTAGDAMLVEFGSAVAALRCAVQLQATTEERNIAHEPERRVSLRIGVSLGEIIVDGEDIFGDEVNLAARIQGLAEPGSVLVSARLREAVEGKVSFAFADLGDRQVKNISRPVRVHQVLLQIDSSLQPPVAAEAQSRLPAAEVGEVPPASSIPVQPAQLPQSRAPTIAAPLRTRPAAPGIDSTGFAPLAPAQGASALPSNHAGSRALHSFGAVSDARPEAGVGAGNDASWSAARALGTQPDPGSSARHPPAVGSTSSLPGNWRIAGADKQGRSLTMALQHARLSTRDGVVFGRVARHCDLSVDNDSISRRHARFRLAPTGTVTIEDLGSTNGTTVDGRRLEPFRHYPLKDGSKVTLGEIKVVFSKADADG